MDLHELEDELSKISPVHIVPTEMFNQIRTQLAEQRNEILDLTTKCSKLEEKCQLEESKNIKLAVKYTKLKESFKAEEKKNSELLEKYSELEQSFKSKEKEYLDLFKKLLEEATKPFALCLFCGAKDPNNKGFKTKCQHSLFKFHDWSFVGMKPICGRSESQSQCRNCGVYDWNDWNGKKAVSGTYCDSHLWILNRA